MKDTKWARGLSSKLVSQVFELEPERVDFRIDRAFHVVTCTITLSSGKGMGIAICSTQDKFDELEGKLKALGRAVSACKHKDRKFDVRDAWDKFPDSWTKRQIERVKNASWIMPSKSMFLNMGDVN